jgi:hypothetical protein
MSDLITIIFRAGEASFSFKRPAFRMPEPQSKRKKRSHRERSESTSRQPESESGM